MRILNVLTPATPRLDIHKLTLFFTLRKLRQKFDHIHWYVNVDCPSMFTETERHKTIRGFIDFSKENDIELRLVNTLNGGHFGRAGRRLFLICRQNIRIEDENLFFWLEDDWIFVEYQVNKFLSFIEEFFKNDKDFILTTDLTYPSGNPIVFKRRFFDEMCKSYIKNYDPELLMIEVTKKLYDLDNPRIDFNIKKAMTHRYPIFSDIGVAWREANNIDKLTNRRETHETNETWVRLRSKEPEVQS